MKTDYLKALISAGFKNIDAVSFVSPKAVPQMADSEEVLKELDPPDDVEIIGIVVNEKGAQRAINTNSVRTLGFPYSVSPTFLRNNQQQTFDEAIDELEKIKNKAEEAGLDTVVYISMAFGNPYGDRLEYRRSHQRSGCARILRRSHDLAGRYGGTWLGQTQIRDVVSSVLKQSTTIWKLAFTCTAVPTRQTEKILAAYDAGCRRFDSAIRRSRAAVLLPRTRWWAISRPKKCWRHCSNAARNLPAIKPLDTLLRISTEIGARYTASHAAD